MVPWAANYKNGVVKKENSMFPGFCHSMDRQRLLKNLNAAEKLLLKCYQEVHVQSHTTKISCGKIERFSGKFFGVKYFYQKIIIWLPTNCICTFQNIKNTKWNWRDTIGRWVFLWNWEEDYLKNVYMSHDGHVFFTDWKFRFESSVSKSNKAGRRNFICRLVFSGCFLIQYSHGAKRLEAYET